MGERTYYVATEYGVRTVRASTAESARRACALEGVHGRAYTRPADAEREAERAGQRAQGEVDAALAAMARGEREAERPYVEPVVLRAEDEDEDEDEDGVWECRDAECGDPVDIPADTAEEAAEDYAAGVDEDVLDGTIWIDVLCAPRRGGKVRRDLEECITITVDPDEPECPDDAGHDWQQPVFLGGDKDNPGVVGHGGGVRGIDVCMICGCARHWTTWGQRRDTGEQGLNAIRYVEREYAEEVARVRDESETD